LDSEHDAVDLSVLPKRALAVREGRTILPGTDLSTQQLSTVIERTREMIEFVTTAKDAVRLVRRASAVEKLVDETLKGCLALEELQLRLQQEAAEAHLRTQRRAGELLTEITKHRGGRPAKTGANEGRVTDTVPTLRQLGIDRHESSRWQAIATLPAERFEGYIADCREHGRELTTHGTVQYARRLRRKDAEPSADARKLSDGAALMSEYDRAAKHVADLIWLDPNVLAAALGPDRLEKELGSLRRWCRWIAEFEAALLATRPADPPAMQMGDVTA